MLVFLSPHFFSTSFWPKRYPLRHVCVYMQKIYIETNVTCLQHAQFMHITEHACAHMLAKKCSEELRKQKEDELRRKKQEEEVQQCKRDEELKKQKEDELRRKKQEEEAQQRKRDTPHFFATSLWLRKIPIEACMCTHAENLC